MRKLLVPVATVAAVLVAVACSSGGGSNGISQGTYTASSYSPGADGCAANFDPTAAGFGTIDVYMNGNSIIFSNSSIGTLVGTATNGGYSAVNSFPFYDQIPSLFSSGVMCTETDTFTIHATVTGQDQMDVTYTANYVRLNGSQCNLLTAYPLPCTSTETFHLTKSGAVTHATPTPTPVAITGTGTITTDRAKVQDATTTSTSNYGAAFNITSTLGGNPFNEVRSWTCTYDQTSFPGNYAISTTDGLGFLLVSTGSFTKGATHAVDNGNSVFVYLTNGVDRNGYGTGGTLTVTSASTIANAGKGCQFSISGLTLAGNRAGP